MKKLMFFLAIAIVVIAALILSGCASTTVTPAPIATPAPTLTSIPKPEGAEALDSASLTVKPGKKASFRGEYP